ncbi:DUF4843 domain-containing protein [Zhouia amylolytica]|uniref:DUF4843 domain-containing protein n=1 Tax=Zhouia amylolytica AD3 TaxID=1286632 RepID=W2UNB9_9FLAO|nr:DUF4843 domain-containing protein [Zhouia amylolytica]ETN94971.1 hypothetical protein P278_21290 [Zhouia amylolytica AD3]
MKTILNYLVVIVVFVSAISCSEDAIDTYKGKDSIYFTWAVDGLKSGSIVTYMDSTGYSFAFDPIDVQSVVYKLPVSVQGNVSDKDRVINVKVSEASTAVEGTHFELPEQVIFHANQAVDSIPLTLFRSPDLKIDTLRVVLELLPNENFDIDMKNKVTDELTQEKRDFTVFELAADDIFKTPSYWFETYLGTYTLKKADLMQELLGIPYDFYESRDALQYIFYHAKFMKRYLEEKKAAGETIYEEDGTEMQMGKYA